MAVHQVALLAVSLLLVIETALGQERYGVAVFNEAGVTGTIRFMPMANGNMQVIAAINGLSGAQTWHVHIFPVDLTRSQAPRCNNNNVGGHYDPLNAVSTLGDQYPNYCSQSNQTACEIGDLAGKLGNIPSTGQLTGLDTTGILTLFGRYGIIGRSVKIHGVNSLPEDSCATIRLNTEFDESTRITTLAATFISPVAGTIFLRQIANEHVAIFGKVFWVDRDSSSVEHNWHIHQNQPRADYRTGTCVEFVGPHYNPFNVNTTAPSYATDCNPMNPQNCEVGDLSNKHAKIDIPRSPSPYRNKGFFYTDSFLNLSSVVNRSIAIHQANSGSPIIACAPLVEVETLEVRNVLREFAARQSNQFENTTVTSSIEASRLRLLSHAVAPNQLCHMELAATNPSTYNPHSQATLDGSLRTPDRFAIGDISGKYNFGSQRRVTDFPIYGADTVAVRTLAETTGTGSKCSSLWPYYPDGAVIRMAKSTFNETVGGAIYFIQRQFNDAVWGNTYVIVDIWFRSPNRTLSTGHNWHIHETPPVPGRSCVSSIGGHFNPFGALLMGNYSTYCTPQTPLRCESGDLGSKHDRLTISQPSSSRITYSYVDSSLNLFGSSNYSIINRSVGLHDVVTDSPLFDCAEIKEVKPSLALLHLQFTAKSDFNRVYFAGNLTQNIDVASSDLLMLSQEIINRGRARQTNGNQCVNMTIRVLGLNDAQADSNMAAVQMQFNSLYRGDPCSGCVLIPSVLLLLSLALATLFTQL